MIENLTEEEKKAFDSILRDLSSLFQLDNILVENIDKVIDSFETREVAKYIKSLREGSQPERALTDAFFAGKSILGKYLADELYPEVSVGNNGYIDFQVGTGNKKIFLEIKSLFNKTMEDTKSGKELKTLYQEKLSWENHTKQVIKYLKGGAKYVVLTNLKDWYIFTFESSPTDLSPINDQTDINSFLSRVGVEKSLYESLERYHWDYIREVLGERFFESLKDWVIRLLEVKFTTDDKKKLEIIISVINRFIFIQTLDDYGVIEFQWISETWRHYKERWENKDKFIALDGFFKEIESWFYRHYDTELFNYNLMDSISNEEGNHDILFSNLELVLGINYWERFLGYRGVLQYNYKFIDEDIFGKAYEIFLAEVRREEAIYYTPKHVTEYIVKETVIPKFEALIQIVKNSLESEKFDQLNQAIDEILSLKVLDPSCGSGSFLVKIYKCIFEEYQKLDKILQPALKKFNEYHKKIDLEPTIENKRLFLEKAYFKLMSDSKSSYNRELISKILLRHVYGVDSDQKALQVAKVNLWLEAIKMMPENFRFDRLPKKTNHILPDMSLNMRMGNSLVGLKINQSFDVLSDKFQDTLGELSAARTAYLNEPFKTELVENIEKLKEKARKELDSNFRNSLNKDLINVEKTTTVMHWGLEFWFAFFDNDGNKLPENKVGFDVIVGNPPYQNIKLLSHGDMQLQKTYFRKFYRTAYGNFDIYIIFIEQAHNLLHDSGTFGYIVPNKFMVDDYGKPLRELLLNISFIRKIVDVSNENVFEDADVYPHILISDKRGDLPDNYTIRIEYGLEKNEGTWDVDLKTLRMMPEMVFAIHFTKEEYELLLKILNLGSPLCKFCELSSGTPGYSAQLVADCLKEKSEDSSTDSIEFIVTGNIDRYAINLGNVQFMNRYFKHPKLILDSGAITSGKVELFKKKKIVIAGMVLKIEAAYDCIGVGLGVNVYAAYDFNVDPYFLLALLNSQLITFYYSIIYRAKHLGGDYLAINKGQLANIPIKEPKTSGELMIRDNLIKSAKELEKLNLQLNTLKEIWREWSSKLANDTKPLSQILIDDRNKITNRALDYLYTESVPFYPNSLEPTLNTEYDLLAIKYDRSKSTVYVYGFLENSRKLIYTLKFRSEELMIHTILSLSHTLDSQKNTRTLKNLLEKTEISIIKPNYSAIKNIIRQAESDWRAMHNKTEKEFFWGIEKEIWENEAIVEANVFKLYEFTAENVEYVMNRLQSYPENIKQILSVYNAL